MLVVLRRSAVVRRSLADLGKKRCLLVTGDFKVVDVETFIERLVEVAADVVGDVAVEPLWVFDQVQRSNDQILWMSLGEAAQVGAPSRG